MMRISSVVLAMMLGIAAAAAADYKRTAGPFLQRTRDGAFVSTVSDPTNPDSRDLQAWLAAGGIPDPADPLPSSVSTGVMLGRLTDAEYTAIMQAASAGVAAGDGQLARWLDIARTLPRIDLNDPTTAAARAKLLSTNLLTPERAAVIFAPD